MKVKFTQIPAGKWYWEVVLNDEVVAVSVNNYARKADARRAFRRILKIKIK